MITEVALWSLAYGGIVLVAFCFGTYVGLRTWKRIWKELQEAQNEIRELKKSVASHTHPYQDITGMSTLEPKS